MITVITAITFTVTFAEGWAYATHLAGTWLIQTSQQPNEFSTTNGPIL